MLRTMPKQFRAAVVKQPGTDRWVVHLDGSDAVEFDDRESATAFAQAIGWDPTGREAASRLAGDQRDGGERDPD